MPIASLNDYIAAAKQIIPMSRTAARTTIAGLPFSVFELAGQPGSGVLAGASVAAGVVPTDAVAGYPVINNFAVSAKGYLSGVTFGSTVASRIALFDRVWLGGAYAFNAAQTLAAQPSYASRMPDGDYKGTQIWIETVTAFTGNLTVTITYTNQDGTLAQSTGSFAPGVAPTLGRCFQVPLAAGDTGVQKIESVTSTIATVGTFNVMVLRPLWEGRVRSANDGDSHDMLKTGLPEIFENSAIYPIIYADSTSSGVPNLLAEISSK